MGIRIINDRHNQYFSTFRVQNPCNNNNTFVLNIVLLKVGITNSVTHRFRESLIDQANTDEQAGRVTLLSLLNTVFYQKNNSIKRPSIMRNGNIG